MNRLLLVVLLAATASAQTEVRRTAVLPSYKELKFPPLPPVKIPEPATFTLPNGMKVYLLEEHELPIVSGVALIRTGNLFDPPDKRGLAEITGEVLRSGGTKAKSGDEIDVQLEDVAASVESQIAETDGTLNFSTLRENTDQVLSVFKDFLVSAEFRDDKVELAKTQTRSAIARRNDEANAIASREFDSIVYGRDTPYGWEIEYADIDNIHREDCLNFYKRYYFPANIMLAVYGDFQTADMKQKLTRLFADWTTQQPPVPKFPEVRKKPAPGVYLAAKTDVTQTFFAVGHLGGVLRDKDYPALEVAAEILGGGFSSRLFQRVRTKLGYAYNISAGWGANYDHPGLFEISGSTQSAHTVDTLKAAREELERIRTTEVADAELKTAKDTVLNGFVFRFDRASKTLNRLLMYEYFGYPKDFIFQYQKAIAAVTKADVLRAAQKYFRPQDLTIVAVGNPKDFGTPLSGLGKVQMIDLTIPEPKKATAAADPASLASGKQQLQRMQQALGGAEKLDSVNDSLELAEVAINTGGSPMKVRQTNSYLKPETMRQDLELPFGKQSVFYSGGSGWLSSPQGVQNLPAPVVKQVQGQLFRELSTLALSDRIPDRTVSSSGDNSLEISDKNGNQVGIELDPSSGLPAKLTYPSASMNGPTMVIEEFSDWRDVAGVKMPFKASITQGGKKFADVLVQDYKINSGLRAEDLSKKP